MAAAIHHGLTLSAGNPVGIKGGWLGTVLHTYPSEMAQSFWTAIWAWVVCFVVTIVVSMATKPRPDSEMVGLVYSLTERPAREAVSWYKRPEVLAGVVLAMAVVLNIIFW